VNKDDEGRKKFNKGKSPSDFLTLLYFSPSHISSILFEEHITVRNTLPFFPMLITFLVALVKNVRET